MAFIADLKEVLISSLLEMNILLTNSTIVWISKVKTQCRILIEKIITFFEG